MRVRKIKYSLVIFEKNLMKKNHNDLYIIKID